MREIEISQTLDTVGLRCPEPVMLTRKAIRHLNYGDVLYTLLQPAISLAFVPLWITSCWLVKLKPYLINIGSKKG